MKMICLDTPENILVLIFVALFALAMAFRIISLRSELDEIEEKTGYDRYN